MKLLCDLWPRPVWPRFRRVTTSRDHGNRFVSHWVLYKFLAFLFLAHADTMCSMFNEAQSSDSFGPYYCFAMSCPLVSTVLPAVDDDTEKQLTTILLLVLFHMRKCTCTWQLVHPLRVLWHSLSTSSKRKGGFSARCSSKHTRHLSGYFDVGRDYTYEF
jgi:hypothetical protein